MELKNKEDGRLNKKRRLRWRCNKRIRMRGDGIRKEG
jgi:hypothetical protein